MDRGTQVPHTDTKNAALGGDTAGRQSCKGLMLQKADQFRREAARLEQLAYATENIGGDAERALYDLLSQVLYR